MRNIKPQVVRWFFQLKRPYNFRNIVRHDMHAGMKYLLSPDILPQTSVSESSQEWLE
jgi:hypothetical protein